MEAGVAVHLRQRTFWDLGRATHLQHTLRSHRAAERSPACATHLLAERLEEAGLFAGGERVHACDPKLCVRVHGRPRVQGGQLPRVLYTVSHVSQILWSLSGRNALSGS